MQECYGRGLSRCRSDHSIAALWNVVQWGMRFIIPVTQRESEIESEFLWLFAVRCFITINESVQGFKLQLLAYLIYFLSFKSSRGNSWLINLLTIIITITIPKKCTSTLVEVLAKLSRYSSCSLGGVVTRYFPVLLFFLCEIIDDHPTHYLHEISL